MSEDFVFIMHRTTFGENQPQRVSKNTSYQQQSTAVEGGGGLQWFCTLHSLSRHWSPPPQYTKVLESNVRPSFDAWLKSGHAVIPNAAWRPQWTEVVKKSGPKFRHNDVKNWKFHRKLIISSSYIDTLLDHGMCLALSSM